MGNFSGLYLAGAGANGSQQSQTFIMHFSDGSTKDWTQSFSDWCSPSNFAGESIIQQQAQWVNQVGNQHDQTNYVYGYAYDYSSLITTPGVTLSSVTLPQLESGHSCYGDGGFCGFCGACNDGPGDYPGEVHLHHQ